MQSQEPETVSNEVIEAEVLEEADKSDAVKNEKSENDKEELMRQEILKLVNALGLRSDDAAVFYGEYGGNADLNKITGEKLINLGKTARAMMNDRLGLNKKS